MDAIVQGKKTSVADLKPPKILNTLMHLQEQDLKPKKAVDEQETKKTVEQDLTPLPPSGIEPIHQDENQSASTPETRLSDEISGQKESLDNGEQGLDQVTIKQEQVKKSGIDYSKWEKINVNDEEEEQEIPKPASPKLTTAPEPVPKTVQQVLDRVNQAREAGKQAFQSGQWQQALTCYSRAIQESLEPTQPQVEPKENDPFAFLDKFIKLQPIPVSPLLYTNRALCHLKLEQYPLVIQDCEAALALDKNLPKAYWFKSQAYKELGEYQKELQDLEHLQTFSLDDLEVEKIQKEMVWIQDRLADTHRKLPVSKDEASSLLAFCEKLDQLQDLESQLYFIDVFFKDQEIKHVFRLHGGFDKIQTSTPHQVATALSILNHVCIKCPENTRLVQRQAQDWMQRFSAFEPSLFGPRHAEEWLIFIDLILAPELSSQVPYKAWFNKLLCWLAPSPRFIQCLANHIQEISNWFEWFDMTPTLVHDENSDSMRSSLKCLFELSRHKSAPLLENVMDRLIGLLDRTYCPVEMALATWHNVMVATPISPLVLEQGKRVLLAKHFGHPLAIKLLCLILKRVPSSCSGFEKHHIETLVTAMQTQKLDSIQLLALLLADKNNMNLWSEAGGLSVLCDFMSQALDSPLLDQALGNAALILSHCALGLLF